jgi:putative nucleotidyltransferase with HDIG domain
MAVAGLTVLAMGVMAASGYLKYSPNWLHLLMGAVLALLVVALYGPLRAVIGLHSVSRASRISTLSLVENIGDELATCTSPQAIHTRLLAAMRLLGFRSALLLWADGERLTAQAAYGTMGGAAWLPASGALAQLLEVAPMLHCQASVSHLLEGTVLMPQEEALLEGGGNQWWLPSAGTQGLRAVLVLERRQDDGLSAEDARVLTSLFRQVVVALEKAELFARMEATNRALEETHRETVRVLVGAMRARDDGTGEHCQRIEGWSERLARRLGLQDEEVKAVRLAALLHDIGKIGIPDSILLKPGPLTAAEWQVMRAHPAIGETILASAGHLGAVVPLVGSHHERWDGSGYPRGLRGEQIPLGARIIAVVDAYSAMTDQRAYREAFSHEEAMEELRQEAGRLFDPAVVTLFEELMGQQTRTNEAVATL